MPYISKEDRKELNSLTELIEKTQIKTPGELNYLVTILCQNFLKQNGENYSNHNSIVGVLDCAKLEWYRRRISEYEDKKILENGDV